MPLKSVALPRSLRRPSLDASTRRMISCSTSVRSSSWSTRLAHPLAAVVPVSPCPFPPFPLPAPLQLPAFTYQCCSHEILSFLWRSFSARSADPSAIRSAWHPPCDGKSTRLRWLIRPLTCAGARSSAADALKSIERQFRSLRRLLSVATARPLALGRSARTASCASRSGSRISATVPLPRMVAPETTCTCR